MGLFPVFLLFFPVSVVLPIEPVHHRADALGDEQLDGVRRAAHRLGHDRPLVRIERRQHVIREVPPGIAAPDTDPHPCEFPGPELRDERLETVVPSRRSGGAGPQPPQLQIHVVHDDQQIGEVDLEVAQQLADGVAAEVHERQRLGQQHARRAPLRHDRVGRRRLPLQPVTVREQIQDVESDVVPGPRVLAARVPQAGDHLHSPPGAYFFFSSSSSLSALPFLITSGSAGATTAAAAASAGAGSSSAFSATTWTIIISGSLIAVHFSPSIFRSRTRTPSCSISSLTSTVMFSGMSPGRTSISISRLTKSTMPPCCFTPRASPLRTIGTVTVSFLSIATW